MTKMNQTQANILQILKSCKTVLVYETKNSKREVKAVKDLAKKNMVSLEEKTFQGIKTYVVKSI